jgi:pimeloyl-ACP methyl ester carboxylesterase
MRTSLGACTAVLLGACAAPRLVDERRQEPYAGLLARYEAAPRTQRSVEVTPQGDEPLDVAFETLDGDATDARPVLVMQPGILADRGTWRFLAGALARELDLVLLDPPGTGRSSAPAIGAKGSPRYSPTWLADCMLSALAAWDRENGSTRGYVLVGHSLGGAVVLRALADPTLATRHAGLLARVKGAALMSPADVATTHRSRAALEIACLGDCKAALGGSLGVMKKQVREGVRENVRHPERDALAGEAARIESLLGRRESRHGVRAMLVRFQPLGKRLEPDLAAARRLADHERAVAQPILMLWGPRDGTLHPTDAERIRERLAHERFVALDGLGHSLHQEGVLRVADELRGFVGELERADASR